MFAKKKLGPRRGETHSHNHASKVIKDVFWENGVKMINLLLPDN